MKSTMPNGIWPVMLTPFTEDNKVDYEALGRLVEWYIEGGVDGLFAVCQSSEMFMLSLEERLEIARFVKQTAAGRVPVIASGHISDSFEDQVHELSEMANTGIDALVLITNRLAREDESDHVWLTNLERLLAHIPDSIPLGLYECPAPYRRLTSPEALRYCADTGRFLFVKDVSCDLELLEAKLQAVRGTDLKIFNANTATLLESFKLGAYGFSGVMGNFHPQLYAWLYRNWAGEPEDAARLMDFLSIASMIEKQLYPVNAKYHLMLEGVLSNFHCRSKDSSTFNATHQLEVAQLRRLTAAYLERYPLE